MLNAQWFQFRTHAGTSVTVRLIDIERVQAEDLEGNLQLVTKSGAAYFVHRDDRKEAKRAWLIGRAQRNKAGA